MKNLKRMISLLLMLCMVASLLPPMQLPQTKAAAAETDAGYYYELDTDGIDPGAKYLIVSGTGSQAEALKMDMSTSWQSSHTTVNVTDGTTIAAFEGDSSCLWSFSSSTVGTVSSNGNYLNIEQYVHYQATAYTMQFAHLGNGRYGIYIAGGANTNLQYLYYDSSVSPGYVTKYQYGVVGTDSSAYAGYLYLFKQVEGQAGYDISFLGNGNTAGQVPEAVTGLEEGATYTIPSPSDDFRKDVGADTYLFWCWTENQDGTGTEYYPGDTVTVTRDMTLYAQWYLQTKYTISFITYLDGVLTDVPDIAGSDRSFFAKLEGQEDAPYIPMTHSGTGTYTTNVTENGTYVLYMLYPDGTEYLPVHGHKVVIYNQSGSTECQHFSVQYDANGGAWEGDAPASANYHANTAVTAITETPTLEGYRFLYWEDQNGNQLAPGAVITQSLTEPTVLTAKWENLVDVTVTVTVNHKPATGGVDNDSSKYDVLFSLLREEGGVNLPISETALDANHSSFHYDEENDVTTYTVVFSNMPQGIYNAASVKTSYEGTITRSGEANEDQNIYIDLIFAPQNADLQFQVKVNADDDTEKALMPQAVNVKVLYWGYNEAQELGWHVISQQLGSAAPTTVYIDPKTGEGSGYFPVWRYWPDGTHAYDYRIELTSFIMPDGRIIPASSNDLITYTPNGSGLYTADVTIEPSKNGRVPDYPEGSNTELPGAYFDGDTQMGIPTATIDITPFTVTFVAGDGAFADGTTKVVLENQYLYPDLNNYVPVPNDPEGKFSGWYVDEEKADNRIGQYLTGDVTYVAQYNPHLTISGTVTAEGTYQQDGQTVTIKDPDRVNLVQVVLQKEINGIFNDYDSCLVEITYDDDTGTGEYIFGGIIDDGSAYRIVVLTLNYGVTYDKEEVTTSDTINATLFHQPNSYAQEAIVDTNRIAEGFRPTDALVRILYRDLGNTRPYDAISQHTVDPFGMMIPIINAQGVGAEEVWNWHNNGSLYEYQLDVIKLYGQVESVFTQEGVDFSDEMPFTVQYSMPAYYVPPALGEPASLVATLIPKDYKVIFDMNLDGDTTTPIQGMNDFVVDNNGQDQFAAFHTWSYSSKITAFPYREGYVFNGWTSNHDGVDVQNHGEITVGAELAQDVTLTAQWTPLTGTDFTIRYLELNTDKVLAGAMAVNGSTEGSVIKATDDTVNKLISGYEYAGAMVGGVYYDKSQDPQLVLSSDPTKNLMVIYYLPDGSDGYTEQVESNLDLDKTAILEDNGTYTVTLQTHTMDNPITTQILQNTPMDIALVLDQSGSIIQKGYLDDLQTAVNNFIALVAQHGRDNKVDHRIAIVGYAGDETCAPTSTDTSQYPIAGGNTSTWVNTGVFDSNGDFHPYPVTGFNYTAYTGTVSADGTYYTYSPDYKEYLLLTYHQQYRHLLTEDEARVASLQGQTVYGYIGGQFIELTRNTSGLWLYGDKQLYSDEEFFTYHQDVWTHRRDLDRRQIHAYGTGSSYTCVDGHDSLYTRQETTDANPELNVYYDALVPVSVGANGSGGVNPALGKTTSHLGSNGGTYVPYGIEMANRVFESNPFDQQDIEDGRIRIMVMFTDGLPGTGTFDPSVANDAIAQAYITKNTHNAYSYTIGLYPSDGVDEVSDEGFFMNAVSSNYPTAQSLDDVRQERYSQVSNGSRLSTSNTYYVQVDGEYYVLTRQTSSYWWYTSYSWTFTGPSGTVEISDSSNPTVSNGKVGGYTIYTRDSMGYKETPYDDYYATTDSEAELINYFAHLMQNITTKITKEIILHEDTIMRDIMGQGLILTPGTQITAYKVPGKYDATTGEIIWSEEMEQIAQVTIPEGNTQDSLKSTEVTTIDYETEDGTIGTRENVPYITVYNLNSANPTNPNEANYQPHAVDITGYDFEHWYINETDHTEGFKMVATITRIEATDDVQWGRSVFTNNEQSGLWLPQDSNGNRQLLLPFEQPSTIFVERAYVLDYGKEFTLSGWYFDDETDENGQITQKADPVHVDCNIANGMNWFDENAPTTQNTLDGAYGNLKYGNINIDENGNATYTPTSMSWGGYDQFYVFGDTWRKTVLAQDANENGNLWNKVTVIPANNIYYEDSFITAESQTANGIEGFTFTGDWQIAGTAPDTPNVEHPEHIEDEIYGGVHGWTDSLLDDGNFTDGTAHGTGINNKIGAQAEFTFTGTGAEVYTMTNAQSGMVVAILNRIVTNQDGTQTEQFVKSMAIDNLAASGEYYHIPTVAFKDLTYGTYQVQLIATVASTATGTNRYEYYIDGVRIYNPLGSETGYASDVVQDAYGNELNAVFTEVRDILLKYGDFGAGTTDVISGAVFIDWIQEGQGTGDDPIGTGVHSYEIGTFETYGPKNEVYLNKGQAIVLKVSDENNYYVGLKSLTGEPVTANISGTDISDPTKIALSHTTDLYYQVTPVNGYIVIQNDSESQGLLSITNLRTTNLNEAAADGGVLPIAADEALVTMRAFHRAMESWTPPVPVEPEKPGVTPEQQVQANLILANALFTAIRQWLNIQ